MAAYKIMSGVHRCVAAREAGLTDVRARVDSGGGAQGPVVLLPLDDLYSPKREIGRWDRGRDLLELVRVSADDALRDTIPPVEVSRLADRLVKYFTRVADVVVNPV